MKSKFSIFMKLLCVQCVAIGFVSQSQGFDFFYFVQQQWPGSHCDTKQLLSNNGFHGLWPNYNDGSYPSNCDPHMHSPFDKSKISDLISRMQTSWPSLACPSSNGSTFWSHEWEKHGTCSESVLRQHQYFEAALTLKHKLGPLQILKSVGIEAADRRSYRLSSISEAIRGATGYGTGIKCNVDGSGKSQVYQIYVCVDKSGSNLIKCPVLPNGGCASIVYFPSF